MAFDHAQFIENRILGKPVSMDEIAEHDTYAAIYSLSMTPIIFRELLAINTVEFTKLSTKVRAKVMQGFNRKKLNTGYLRAFPQEINKKNSDRDKVMAVYECSFSSADSMMRNGEIDMKLVEEMYDYKVKGLAPVAGGKRGRKK